ncbi:hypothetical protein [Longitalea luteola]|uniref:hypothetical protein n=1 Tax=Longitalea luteola TaxID=2812563 RepID=UPI001A96DD87|nr:hypothetical protein [Longitalea luteola]
MRRTHPLLILSVLFAASFAIIGTLAFISKKVQNNKNGFTRRLIGAALVPRARIAFPVVINRMIGNDSGRLLFQGNSPYSIYVSGPDLASFQHIALKIQPDSKINSGIRMFLQDHHIYVSCRNMPGIISYDLNDGTVRKHALSYFYSKEACISKDNFILRTNDPLSKDPIFTKINLNNTAARFNDQFSDRNGQSNFLTDGVLYFDATTRLACYTYFYQNGFICMDTNLNITLRARTIDTISKREIKVARVGSSLTMKSPPKFVNYLGAVAAGTLYLQSAIKADNEYQLDHAENSVIDMYDLKKGSYKGSFYIPAHEGKKLHQFHVIGKNLYAVYGKNVVMYDLSIIPDHG